MCVPGGCDLGRGLGGGGVTMLSGGHHAFTITTLVHDEFTTTALL